MMTVKVEKASPRRKVMARMLKNLKSCCTEMEGNLYVKKCYKDRTQYCCVPDEYIDDDLLYAIRSKFYYFFKTVTDEVEHQLGINISLIIDPSYEDCTHVVAYVPEEKLVVLEYSAKAWHFGGFGKNLANALFDTYESICENYNSLKKNFKTS